MASSGCSEIMDLPPPPPGISVGSSSPSPSPWAIECEDDDYAYDKSYLFESDKEEYYDENGDDYLDQYLASDGFDIDHIPNDAHFALNITLPMSPEGFADRFELLTRLSNFAIDRYNLDNNTKYKLVKPLKSTYRVCSGFEYKITLEAKDATDAEPKIFQAAVWNGVVEDQVLLCRLKTTNVEDMEVARTQKSERKWSSFYELPKEIFHSILNSSMLVWGRIK